MKRIDVLYCLNNAYAPKMAAAVASLLDSNRHIVEYLWIHVRSAGGEEKITETTKENIKKIVKRYGLLDDHLRFYASDDLENRLRNSNLASFKGNYMTYYKIFGLADIDCGNILIVLDSDTLCMGNIEPMINYVDEKKYIAIAIDSKRNWHHSSVEEIEYNCGVMVINMEQYRTLNVEKILLDYIPYMPEDWIVGDQTIISLALAQSIRKLPEKYNFILQQLPFEAEDFYYIKGIDEEHYYTYKEWNEARNAPIILHLIRGNFLISPWYKCGEKKLRKKWLSYLKDTCWEGYGEKYGIKSFVVVLGMKALRYILPHKKYIEFIKLLREKVQKF